MAALASRSHLVCGPSATQGNRLLAGRPLPRRSGVVESYKARIASVDEQESREHKVLRLAQILGCDPENIQCIVRVFPGLLVPDCSLFEQRVPRLARKYQVPQHEVAQIVLANPTVLFERV